MEIITDKIFNDYAEEMSFNKSNSIKSNTENNGMPQHSCELMTLTIFLSAEHKAGHRMKQKTKRFTYTAVKGKHGDNSL